MTAVVLASHKATELLSEPYAASSNQRPRGLIRSCDFASRESEDLVAAQ